MTGSANRRTAIGFFGLFASAVVCTVPCWAQPSPSPPTSASSNPAPAAFYRLPARTAVAVQLVDAIGTHEAKSGDMFALRLAAPVILDGQVVLPAGTPGVGRVVQSSPPGMGGKGAKLVVSAEYLSVPGGAVPLQALQLAAIGKDQSLKANASSIGGLVFFPLGLVGFAVTGGDIEIPAGTAAMAKTALTVDLPPVAVASSQDYAAAQAMAPPQSQPGSFVLPDPPPGMGQVVFFREHTLLGSGQWFNVRDDGETLGRLNNGAFFIAPVPAGLRAFTARTEPEFNDQLTLKIDPGETYFVEAVLTKGVVIGVPNLTPSDRARFDALSSQMQALPAAKQTTAAR